MFEPDIPIAKHLLSDDEYDNDNFNFDKPVKTKRFDDESFEDRVRTRKTRHRPRSRWQDTFDKEQYIEEDE